MSETKWQIADAKDRYWNLRKVVDDAFICKVSFDKDGFFLIINGKSLDERYDYYDTAVYVANGKMVNFFIKQEEKMKNDFLKMRNENG